MGWQSSWRIVRCVRCARRAYDLCSAAGLFALTYPYRCRWQHLCRSWCPLYLLANVSVVLRVQLARSVRLRVCVGVRGAFRVLFVGVSVPLVTSCVDSRYDIADVQLLLVSVLLRVLALHRLCSSARLLWTLPSSSCRLYQARWPCCRVLHCFTAVVRLRVLANRSPCCSHPGASVNHQKYYITISRSLRERPRRRSIILTFTNDACCVFTRQTFRIFRLVPVHDTKGTALFLSQIARRCSKFD